MGHFFLLAAAPRRSRRGDDHMRRALLLTLALAVVVAGAIAIRASPAPRAAGPPRAIQRSNPPAVIAGRGYRLVFSDEFSTVTFGAAGPRGGRRHIINGKWHDHIWYDPYPPRGAIYGRSGILHLVSKRSDGFPNISIASYHPDAAPRRTFRQGYFEARMKWDARKGAWPAFWLNSSHWAAKGSCPPDPAELDIFEGQGAEPNVFYGTLHRSTNSYPGCSSDATNDGYRWQPTKLTGAWHRYAALWTRSDVIWYLDGREVTRTKTFASTGQDMQLILDSWVGGWTTKPDSSIRRLDTQIDWVRVWQK
jgi:Glycosyl hydrolases family 16